MEDEAFRRAVNGTEKPVYQGKELVGHVREYSDTLMIFMLKARRPEKFKDRVASEISGGLTVKDERSPEEIREGIAGKLAGLSASGGA